MSQKEVDRLGVMQQLGTRHLTQIQAAKVLGTTTRQIRRLVKRFQQQGAKGLLSKHRHKASNHRLKQDVLSRALTLLTSTYVGFGPTLAHEKLIQDHDIKLSVESLRQLMMKYELWRAKQRKKATLHQMRERRPCLGELVQIDGSPHDWFEGRAPRCCLLVFIDDATGQLMQLRFVSEECTQGYFDATQAYLKAYGRPVAFYSDKHSIFRVNIPEAKSGTGETQFGRAMRELGIELICAHSPQAKGRVERANRTLQDRLVKELRLRNIKSIDEANAFLPTFQSQYNKRFAKEAASPVDAHRKTLPSPAVLDKIFSLQETRKLSKNLELSYNNRIYQIQTDTPSYTMRKALVTVCDKQGEITLLYKHKTLEYKIFDKKNRPTQVLDSKQIERPYAPKATTKPKPDHPWRKYADPTHVEQSQPPVSP